MVASLHGVEDLSRSLAAALGLPTVPAPVARAAELLAAATTRAEVDAAVAAYANAVAAAAGGDADRAVLLRAVATRGLEFLAPARDAVAALVDAARAADVEVRAAVAVGPARLDLVAPAADVVLATGTARVRRVVGHLPVDGLALDLALGSLSARGAGFLRPPPDPAAGAVLAADLGVLQVTVALLVESRGGDLALVGLLRAEFRPTGLQLGLGFSLDAVGGVVGIGRVVDVDALRAGLGDGSALDVLFGGTASTPAGMHRVLAGLATMFPARPGAMVLGPMLRLGWLTAGSWTLVRADVGVVVELPRARVVVVGRVVVEVPGPGVPLVHLRLDVLGEVDPAGRRLALDAALVDSTVLGALRVSGTAAVRMHWGDPATTLVTVGGFFPGFDPRPALVPPQRRIAIDLANPVPAGLTIHAEGYVALGAGTMQAGARLELAFEVAGCGVRGAASVDALVQLSPLWFTATVAGSVRLRAMGQDLLNVDLRGRLSGPGPLVLDVEATTEVLGIEVGGRTTFVLDGTRSEGRGAAGDLPAAVRRQLALPANVRAANEGDAEVVLAPRPPTAGAALAAPGAPLSWSQSSFPLGDPVEKADGRVLAAPAVVTVTAVGRPTTEVRELLPTAAFLDLTDAEVLAVPPFDRRICGLTFGSTDEAGGPERTVTTEYRTLRLPTTVTTPWRASAWALSGMAVATAVGAAAGPPRLAPGVPPAVRVAPEPWVVVDGGDLVADPGSAPGAASAHARSRATSGTAMPRAAALAVLP